jgi:hypothetical protein
MEIFASTARYCMDILPRHIVEAVHVHADDPIILRALLLCVLGGLR